MSFPTERMEIQCPICHSECRIPVRFKCFPCPNDPGKPNCSSVIRVCLSCAREYLQLNKPRSHRVEERKCLLCPAVCAPRRLNATLAYEKDFLIMTMDTNTYSCFHSEQGCDFTGRQNELDRHIQHECPHRTIFCTYCNTFYMARDMDTHKRECSGWFLCHYCQQYVQVEKMDAHYREHHVERCNQCGEFVSSGDLQQHKHTRCLFRNVECTLCNTRMYACLLRDHLHKHLSDARQRIARATRTIAHETETMEQVLYMLKH